MTVGAQSVAVHASRERLLPGEPALPGRRHGPRPWLVLVAQSIFVIVLYGPTLRIQFLSDAWFLLDNARRGLVWAVTTPIGWHYIPVATGFNALVYHVLGTEPAAYQGLMLVLHLGVGHLVYRLGLRWLGEARVAFAASLLFLGSASYYEVSCWPLVANAYALGALFYLMGMSALFDMVESGRTSPRNWHLAGWLALAVFCYPGMITLAPLSALTLAVSRFRRPGRQGIGRPWRDPKEWLWVARAFVPSALTAGLPLLARLRFAATMYSATVPRLDWVRAYSGVHATLSALTLQASGLPDRLLTLGIPTRSMTLVRPLAWAWVALFAAVVAHAFAKSRNLATPVLWSWLLLQTGLAALSLMVSSRHLYLAAVPAALLLAILLDSAGIRLEGALREIRARRLLRQAPLVLGTLILLAGAYGDLRLAVDAAREATAITTQSIAAVRSALAAAPGTSRVVLVDTPGIVRRGTISAYVFTNGLQAMVPISIRRPIAVDIRHTHDRPADAPNGSRRISSSELRMLAEDPSQRVLFFDAATRQLRDMAPDE
jgi:hypothetical protein